MTDNDDPIEDAQSEDVPAAEPGLVVESDELVLEEQPVSAPPPLDEPEELPDEWEPDDGPEELESEDDLPAAFVPVVDDDGVEPPDEPVVAPPRHRGRRILLGLGLVVAALYVAGYFLTGLRMPAQAEIGGVDVGGMSPSAARHALDEALTPHAADKVLLVHDTSKFPVSPTDAGLALDLDGSVDAAGGRRSWNPADMVGLLFGTHRTPLVLHVDEAKLQGVIDTIGEAVNRPVVEAQITFPKAKPTAREPVPGLVVSRSDTAEAIKAAYLVSKDPVEVPTVAVEPSADASDLAEMMKTFAEPAMSGPVTLKVDDKEVKLPVTAYAPALVVRVQDNQLKPYIDPKKLAKPLTDSTTGIGKKAVDATVRIIDGKPQVVPGKPGVGLQPEEMATKLIPALAQTGEARSVPITAKVVEPEFTTEDAKALKITERISSFVTKYPHAAYRNINQSRAAEIMNGTILKPGETFSFNDTVGERTVANGFTTGTVIHGGVYREELGGGVSQVVTTTYNAAFFGGMVDVEHHPHAFYIDRYPVGREATVYYGNLDLRFKNPTKYGVLIRAYVVKSTPSTAGEMHVELWSTKVWDIKAGKSARRNFRSPGTQYDDTDRCVPQSPIQGFDIDIYRMFYQDGKKVRTETDTAHYRAADHVICGKKPPDN